MVPHSNVTTAFDLPGYRIRMNLGVVRGIVVRSQWSGGFRLRPRWAELCEQTRQDAFDLMLQHASELGANAVIGVRYDAAEVTQGFTEVLAYGTAVEVEPAG
jgi:uncharacterized protein YbjQ (UPF0145 family)